MEDHLHVDLITAQSPPAGTICGDVVQWERSAAATTFVVCDGLGHGVGAHLAATMTAARAMALLRQGYSPRQAFTRLVRTLNEARGQSTTYTAFSLVRILRDGAATILGYEAPPPILIQRHRQTMVLPLRSETVDQALITEANCFLAPGEALLVSSDGITQAGLGRGLPRGWQADGIARFADDHLAAGGNLAGLPDAIHREARQLWGRQAGDDCTVVAAVARQGRSVALFTGPPGRREQDHEAVRRFLALPGPKVVCGGTTATLIGRVLNRKVEVEDDDPGLAPPSYRIRGLDLVTEGAVTLNQVYNILGEEPRTWGAASPVTELAELLHGADRVEILLGTARNPAAGDIAFRQLGVLSRETIVRLLADKLQAAGKLVVIHPL